MTAFAKADLYSSYPESRQPQHPHHHQQQQPLSSVPGSGLVDPMDDPDSQFTTLFCRALYNYDAQDSSALSFKQDDIIEVLSQQPTGWWDGLLGEERGWFPSNYVEIISDEEAEAAFSGSEIPGATNGLSSSSSASGASDAGGKTTPGDSTMLNMSEALMRGSQSENEEWLDKELAYRSSSRATTNPGGKAQTEDCWIPEITPDNQIWYVNERTGERSRDYPRDSEEDVSDSDLGALSSASNSRSTTSLNASYTNGSTTPHTANSSVHSQSTTEAPPSARTRTPEPWVKKLHEDGTYYYLNTLDGSAQWTRPSAPAMAVTSATPTDPSRLFVEPQPRDLNPRLSVYSDSSDVQPFDYPQRRRNAGPDANGNSGGIPVNGALELTSAEKIAKTLQKSLEPPPVDRITDLSTVATNAIHAVLDTVQSGLSPRRADDYARLDEFVSYVVITVRSLLYVAAVPTGHISSSVLPKGIKSDKPPTTHTATLKPMQRRVTATLSRLVLSARALQYDSGSQVADTLSRIETDAEELERAIIAFVVEVERVNQNAGLGPSKKRLEGVFGTENLGMGMVGAGAGASWKGFGWVPLEEGVRPPGRVLGSEVVVEINGSLSGLQDTIAGLGQALRINNDSSVELVRQKVQQSVTQISAFLSSVADVNIARHVDIDGIRQDEAPISGLYAESVSSARRLVRQLETIVQALYDDAAALLLTSQNLTLESPSSSSYSNSGERESSYDLLDKLSMTISTNLSQCRQTIEAVLAVGREQEDMPEGDYNGSIDWRMSRQSMISHLQQSQFKAPLLQPGGGRYEQPAYEDSEGEGMVGLEDAFARGVGSRKASSAQEYPYESPGSRGLGGMAPGANGAAKSGPYQNGYSVTEETLEETLVSSENDAESEGDVFSDEDDLPPVRAKVKSKKLEKFLGAEYADKVAADSVAWYLRPSYSPSDIIIETDGSVKGGTVPALVERLTAHEQTTDRVYSEAFFMAFKSFTTVSELVDLLIARYRIQPPEGLKPEEHEEWVKLKQNIIQLRVMNTFKAMIQGEDIFEKEDLPALEKIKAFINSDVVASKSNAAKPLLMMIERMERGKDTVKMINTTLAPPPAPIVPKVAKKLRFTDIEPLELARQLTLMESGLYVKIKPMECLQRAREQKAENMDNITMVIQTSNKIADWVADLVLTKEDSRKRANVIKHLISVADCCRTLNNFSSMIAITSGLNTPPIRRLKRTWEQVNQRHLQIFQNCEATIDSNRNFNQYRQLMARVTPPCVPFIGVFLSTLQFIQDGNPDTLPGGLVNFKKRQKASEVISDIKRWQTQTFNLTQLPVVMNFIEESLNQYNDTKASSDHFWALSLEREPREREDEKMARLLQESGFL